MTNTAIAEQRRISGLDTVRAFAALSVMLAHILGPMLPGILQTVGVSSRFAALSRYIFTGHPAVIVFFVVSGFCIHYPYTRRPLPLVAFTVARWTRIMIPALTALLLAKMLHIDRYNFVDGFILWSIVCELWYYTLYPLFLRWSNKIPFETQFAVTFVFSLVLVFNLGSNQFGSSHIYGPMLNWLVALPAWLLGCVLAKRVSAKSARKHGKPGIYLWRIVIMVVAAALYWLTMNTKVGYYLTMNPFAILVYFWIRAEISAQHETSSLFEWMGKWSYSLYLFHMVLIVLVQWCLDSSAWVIPVVLCLCYLAYRLVERPSHEYARHLFRKCRELFSWPAIVPL